MALSALSPSPSSSAALPAGSSSSSLFPLVPSLPSHSSQATTVLRFLCKSNKNTKTNKLSLNSKWRSKVSFFPSFFKTRKDIATLKDELLEAIALLDRGADATPEDKKRVDQIVRELEAVNPVKQPLKSDLLNGKWELIYIPLPHLFCKLRPKILRSQANYQAINTDTLRAQNMESWPFFNQVTADLTPLDSSKVAVKFDYFKIASLIPIKGPDRARGELEITYLDEELRISRGDKGNLFILKMIDPLYRVPV